MTHFQDTSIFQGIVEFSTPDNGSYQCHMSQGTAKVYRLEGDSWVFDKTIKTRAKTPRPLFNAIMRAE